MISENLFLNPPDAEKPLWHSQEYEVKSGVLFLPGVRGPMQRQGLDKVCNTYGKTFHFWQVDRGDELPLGLPQLMMAFSKDDQLNTNLAQGLGRELQESVKADPCSSPWAVLAKLVHLAEAKLLVVNLLEKGKGRSGGNVAGAPLTVDLGVSPY
ncbi:hypothetical protein NE237_012944 [Protea cynaroides]|uniref:Uncharacterized protein n=1 Tax=Protea cynaroides TaxID=273540 RepID=A0A9Q0JY36_9MAGN|nr:hypothetical protein NE237_012944 [Protea cynaroides]